MVSPGKAILWPRIALMSLAAMLVAVAALATPAAAQSANIRSITFYTVKPDRIIRSLTELLPRPLTGARA